MSLESVQCSTSAQWLLSWSQIPSDNEKNSVEGLIVEVDDAGQTLRKKQQNEMKN